MAVVYRAIDDVGFEYYARQMYLYDARHNVPTYIIGSGLGSGPIDISLYTTLNSSGDA